MSSWLPVASVPIMTGKIRIQHYVPKFCLRKFSVKKGNHYLTNCFDKTSQKTFLVNIENVAAETYFYDTDMDTNQTIEQSLGKHESNFNAAYVKLLKIKNFRALKRKEKESLLFFVA